MQQEQNPPTEPVEPDGDEDEGEGRGRGRGRDRPIDPATGKPVHPHGGPPGQTGRTPKTPKSPKTPKPDDQGGEPEGETGGA